MSSFVTTCAECGETYHHMFVGTTLYGGHICPANRMRLTVNPSPWPTSPDSGDDDPKPPTTAGE